MFPLKEHEKLCVCVCVFNCNKLEDECTLDNVPDGR